MSTAGDVLHGRLEQLSFVSELLKDNPLGDPHERPLWVYLPAGYDQGAEAFPTVYLLQGWGGRVPEWGEIRFGGRTVIQLIDDAFAHGRGSAVVVCVDGSTRYGGSQWVDSVGTGRYHSYLCDEVVPYVESCYRVIPDRDSRAVIGKSSGGFGALVAAMLRPDVFANCASHAGDSLYEDLYRPHLPSVVDVVRSWDGDVLAWWDGFDASRADVSQPERIVEYVLGVSACFSPDPSGRPVLPVDTVTGELRHDVWRRWLDWDPVNMIARYAESVRSLRRVWVDAGADDEFGLYRGAAALDSALVAAGVAPDAVHFEIVPGADHDSISTRQVDSLCWLTTRL